MKWFNTLSHNRWLEQETDRIFSFGKNAAVPTGFGWLGNSGQVRADMGTHLWITARMLHVYSVAASMGRPGAYQLVSHGINALNGALRDKRYGGWYACVNDEGVMDASKQGYQHFFVLLGAASAVTTGHPQARQLLDDAIEVIEKYFWSEGSIRDVKLVRRANSVRSCFTRLSRLRSWPSLTLSVRHLKSPEKR